ncbi:hypothetical protein [Streptomyces sp. NPDC016845]|uniref:hypothetical protein n=1 Tax=Streptomyces sp. NPDC016845 TaxID=3364972 RepID=UPI0037A559D9
MSAETDVAECVAELREEPGTPSRWVIWHMSADEVVVFDRRLNIPFDVDEKVLGDVLRRLREAGTPETDAYPGRPCG